MKFTPYPTILFDLDDTLHEAEDRLMSQGWNHILKPWGRVWNKSSGKTHLIGVRNDQRPGVGINTREVIKHFITVLPLKLPDISIHTISNEWIYKDELINLIHLSKKENVPLINLINLLEKERVAFLIRYIEKRGITPIPHAVDMVKRFSKAGYKIGIVTQSPKSLALLILEQLGLLTSTKRFVDTVVSGEMVHHPKPHPESLQLAMWQIHEKELVQVLSQDQKNSGKNINLQGYAKMKAFTHLKPLALVGDSLSDVKAAKALDVSVIIVKNGHTTDKDLLKAGDKVIIVNSLDEVFTNNPIFTQSPSSIDL